MKILQLLSYFGSGGTEEYVKQLSLRAQQQGHEVTLAFNAADQQALQGLKDQQLTFFYLTMRSSLNPISLIKSAQALKKQVRDKNIELVHVHYLREHHVALVAKILGAKIKVIRTFHRMDQFSQRTRFLSAFYQRWTDAFIAISKAMLDVLHDHGLNQKVFLIEHGVAAIGADQHEIALGFLGRVCPEKGILEFIKHNQALLKTTKLVVAGDGPDLIPAKKFVKQHKLRVEFMGFVKDKLTFFQKIAVLILPSATEAVPLVVLEAFSCGVPVVAFDIDDLKSIIGPQNGRLITFPDYFVMGEQAQQLLVQAQQFDQTNRKLYQEKYSLAKLWNETSNLYLSTLDGGGHSSNQN